MGYKLKYKIGKDVNDTTIDTSDMKPTMQPAGPQRPNEGNEP